MNAARAVLSGICRLLDCRPAGKEVGQHILWCSHRTYRGNPIHVRPRCYLHRLRPSFREHHRHQEQVHKFEVLPIRAQAQDTAGRHLRKVRKRDLVYDLSDFVQNPHFLDSRTVAGLSLHRWVRRTEWTTKKQIEQCPTHVIPLHSVLYQGWNSYWIRHIAEGKPTFFAGFRSMAETVFCHALFSKLREESIDLDELGMMMSGSRVHQGSPITNDVKLQASQELAGKVEAPDPKVAALENQIHMLQQQIARFEQSPAPSAAREPTSAGSATPSPVPANSGQPSLPINGGLSPSATPR